MMRWILALSAGAILAADAKVLASFPKEKTDISRWMEANGWVSKRDDPGRFGVGDEALHMVSDKDSVMIGAERGFPVDCRETPLLQIRFRIGKGTPEGKGWVTVERNLAEDYKKVFKEEPVPALRGIMVKCDSNNTGTSAEAWLSSIKLAPPPQPPAGK